MRIDVVLVLFGWNPIAWTVPSSRHIDSINGTLGNLPARMVLKILLLTKPPRDVILPCHAMELFVRVFTLVVLRQFTAAVRLSTDGQPQA